MVKNLMSTDYNLLDPSNMVSIQQYPTFTTGFEVWRTEWSDNHDDEGRFNRWIDWGPFQDLHEILERIGLLDNKIAIVYNNGLVLGYYDGVIRIGTYFNNRGGYFKTQEEILQRFNKVYLNKRYRKTRRP
jgi:hypothetical protein